MVSGSISRCVCSGVSSVSESAMSELFSSFTSTYSTTPLRISSDSCSSPDDSWRMCMCVRRDLAFSTTSSGRHT